ncbi:transposase [Streptomyces sp. NPDC001552]|uniref:transposase n=1 Tax=Streptomyces sp. NPDC001552 TaxID=3364587 RepID=UPI003684EE04
MTPPRARTWSRRGHTPVIRVRGRSRRRTPAAALCCYKHDWLTTIRLPAYAPDLNPVEAVWSLVRGATASTAFDTPDDLDRKLRREIRRIQLRPHLIGGCLTSTGLAINPPTPP